MLLIVILYADYEMESAFGDKVCLEWLNKFKKQLWLKISMAYFKSL